MTKPFSAAVFAPFHAYPDDLLPALQETLALIADIDFLHAREREAIEDWDGPEDERERRLAELETRRLVAREPYLRHLDAIEQRMRLMLRVAAQAGQAARSG